MRAFFIRWYGIYSSSCPIVQHTPGQCQQQGNRWRNSDFVSGKLYSNVAKYKNMPICYRAGTLGLSKNLYLHTSSKIPPKTVTNILQYTFNNVVRQSSFSRLHTTSKLLIIVSRCYKKRNEFENPYEDLLKKQKKKASPLIMLIDTNENVEVMTLIDASKLATKRNLKLVKVEDSKRTVPENKPLYQLMTGKEYHEERMQEREKKKEKHLETGFKGEKAINISSAISDYDLQIKIKQMVGWIEKHYQVRVIVTTTSDTTKEASESIATKVEEGMKECGGRVLQKIFTDSGGLKFFINPPKLKKLEESELKTNESAPS